MSRPGLSLNSPLNLSSSRLAPAASLPTLPRLLPQPPLAGRKTLAKPLTGSTDALALAQYATDATERGELTAVVCAEALAAQRLAAEIAWFAPGLRVATLPDWETLPYDHFSPHQDLVSERLATLYHASRGECDVLLVAATTALYRLAPPSYLAAFTFFLSQREKLDVDALRSQLALGGYQHVTQVVSPGEFSVRGGLIDLYPMGSALPYRIDLLDEEIESIKAFDVDSQRTLYPVPNIRLLPAREFPLDDAARTRFRGRYREVFEGDPSKSGLYRDISNGITPGGIEYYLPLFFDATAILTDYLPANATLCVHGAVGVAIERFWQDTEARYRLLRGDSTRPLLPPHSLFVRVDASPALAVGPAQRGFIWPEGGLALITEAELYADVARNAARRDARRSNVETMLRDLSEVRIGDPVVHEQHGIGRYLGLTTLDLGDGANEFLQLLYANDAKLYVPVSSLHLIGRYSGASPEAAPLHELGSRQWDKAKKRAARQAHDTAAELLNLYAQRAARKGHAFAFTPHEYEAFADAFPFEETADQQAAIDAVIADLTAGKPMDRLVCGDVGFGKTEVALRAAFVAIADRKQVAVLCPTTLLAEQHLQTFADRFADWPVRIAELSRFRSSTG